MISFALLALAPLAVSPTVECDEREPSRCAASIRKGEAAPFDGQVLTTSLAIALGQKAESCDARIAIELEHAKRVAAIDLELERRLRSIEAEASIHARQALERYADELRPRWWEKPIIVSGVTAGVVLLAVFAVGQLR